MQVMPAIPATTVTSPKRPLPKLFMDQQTFSTKKEKERTRTPITSNYPRPPIKSCPPISRVFSQIKADRPRIVSFNKQQHYLSPYYDCKRKGSYFDQAFHLDCSLGYGSFGVVFKVTSKDDGKCYAVKKSIEKFKGDIDRKRKMEEVSKHESLPDHKNCVKFYNAWEERQHLYIRTELCEMSLAKYSDKEHNIPESLVWDYLCDLLQAVEHLHSHNLLHMDIKPDNVFITPDQVCKLGDFGLILDLNRMGDGMEAQEGDPKYLAPELLEGKFTKAADIYSLGVTMLELATDMDVPKGGEPWHQLRRLEFPENLFQDKQVSPRLAEIIKWMMEPDIDLRPTVQDLLNASEIKRNITLLHVKRTTHTAMSRLKVTLLPVWYYLLQIFSLCSYILPFQIIRSLHDRSPDSAPSSQALSSIPNSDSGADVTFNNSSSPSTDLTPNYSDVFIEDGSISGTEPHEDSSEPKHKLRRRAVTTGKAHRKRQAVITGLDESPSNISDHSIGSPLLSTNSRKKAVASCDSDTTPPSACKKILFTDDDLYDIKIQKNTQLVQKNLLSAFDDD